LIVARDFIVGDQQPLSVDGEYAFALPSPNLILDYRCVYAAAAPKCNVCFDITANFVLFNEGT